MNTPACALCGQPARLITDMAWAWQCACGVKPLPDVRTADDRLLDLFRPAPAPLKAPAPPAVAAPTATAERATRRRGTLWQTAQELGEFTCDELRVATGQAKTTTRDYLDDLLATGSLHAVAQTKNGATLYRLTPPTAIERATAHLPWLPAQILRVLLENGNPLTTRQVASCIWSTFGGEHVHHRNEWIDIPLKAVDYQMHELLKRHVVTIAGHTAGNTRPVRLYAANRAVLRLDN